MNRSSRPRLSVVIPAFNEEARIRPTLEAARAWLTAQPYPSEILVVDDGSWDETREVVRGFAAGCEADALAGRGPAVELVESFPNHGKGHVVRLGLLTALGELRLFMDADGSTPISELPKLLARIEAGADVAIGSRRAPGAELRVRAPLYRRLWSRLTNRIVQAGLLEGIHDTQCGFKLFTREAAQAVFRRARTAGWGFDLEVLALARRLGYRVDEVPVVWADDRRSRIHPLRDAWRITLEFLRIRRAFRRGDYDLPERPPAVLATREAA